MSPLLPFLPRLSKPRQLGFTLIELLVAISLVTVLVTAGISAYTTSQNRVLVRAARDQLVNILNSIHQDSLIGNRPADCSGPFEGYLVTVSAGSGLLTATPLCSLTNGTPANYELSNLTFANSQSFTFLPLVAGIDLGGDTLNLDYRDFQNNLHRFLLSRSGTIEYLGLLP